MDYHNVTTLAERAIARQPRSSDTEWTEVDDGFTRRIYRGVRISAIWCEALGSWGTTVGSSPNGGEAADLEQAQLIAEEYVDAYSAHRGQQ